MKFDYFYNKYKNKNEISEEDLTLLYKMIKIDFDDDTMLVDMEIHPLADYDYKKIIKGCNIRTKGNWIFKVYKRKEFAGIVNIKNKYGNMTSNIIYLEGIDIHEAFKGL